jgi:hypothetical protein
MQKSGHEKIQKHDSVGRTFFSKWGIINDSFGWTLFKGLRLCARRCLIPAFTVQPMGICGRELKRGSGSVKLTLLGKRVLERLTQSYREESV